MPTMKNMYGTDFDPKISALVMFSASYAVELHHWKEVVALPILIDGGGKHHVVEVDLASKQSPTHGLGTKFPLWLLAGPACWQSDGAAIPNRFLLRAPFSIGRSASFRILLRYLSSVPVKTALSDSRDRRGFSLTSLRLGV
jgi:hypothetical protein